MTTAQSFQVGRFTVRIGLRPDNPSFPVYLVFVGERMIGKHFSRPSESDCQWLERESRVYATESRLVDPKAKYRRPGPGRPRKSAIEPETVDA